MTRAFTKQTSRVSIHASAREATTLIARTGGITGVSIHASAREATCQDQSHSQIPRVSIHASAREATVTGVGLRG